MCVRQHGSAVEIRARDDDDDDDDGEENGGGAPSCRRRDDGAGRGEGDRAEQQCRDVDAVDGTQQGRCIGALQERRLQGLEKRPRQRAAYREPLAFAQNCFPALRDRGVPPLDHRLYPAGPISDLVTSFLPAVFEHGDLRAISRDRVLWIQCIMIASTEFSS